MTILICLLLLLASIFLLARGKQRWALRLLVADIVLIMAIGSGLVPALLLSHVQLTDNATSAWTGHDSIVLLGAGTTVMADNTAPQVPLFGYSRVAITARSYFSCRDHQTDCKIVVSGGDPQHHGMPEAEVNAALLRALRVPKEDILLEPRSNNTWQNADYSTKLAGDGRMMTVVTSGLQLKRALLYFRHFSNRVRGLPADALTVDIAIVPSSINFYATDALLHEQIGITRYYIYNALGLNAPKRK